MDSPKPDKEETPPPPSVVGKMPEFRNRRERRAYAATMAKLVRKLERRP